jgi:hypothetical protein
VADKVSQAKIGANRNGQIPGFSKQLNSMNSTIRGSLSVALVAKSGDVDR